MRATTRAPRLSHLPERCALPQVLLALRGVLIGLTELEHSIDMVFEGRCAIVAILFVGVMDDQDMALMALLDLMGDFEDARHFHLIVLIGPDGAHTVGINHDQSTGLLLLSKSVCQDAALLQEMHREGNKVNGSC